MAGKDYKIDFSAADPALYSRLLPKQIATLPSSRDNNPLSGAADSTSVESLASKNLALGQIVPFEFRISVDQKGKVNGDKITVTAGWETVTTNGSLFGYDGDLGVIAAFVDSSDSNGSRDTDATVSNFDWTLVGTEIQGTFEITNLDPGEEIVLEAWVVLQDEIPDKIGGNVHSRLIGAETSGTVEAEEIIRTGNQTIPLKQVKDLLTTQADLSLVTDDSTEDNNSVVINLDTTTPGIFKVNPTGQVQFDYLFDGGWFQGELAVFSLKGMETYEAGSTKFITEAARRALSNSEEGRILLQDRQEGAKFAENFQWEKDFNAGEYQGVKTFDMTAGDELAFMLVQHTSVREIYQSPNNISKWGKLPIFSIPEANPFGTAPNQIVAVDNNGTLAFEDVRIDQGKSDQDYNDIVFQVRGLEGNVASIDDHVNPNRDWRTTEVGQELLQYADRTIFNEGVFEVGETGEMTFDFLYDGGWFQGELAVFSLQGMGGFQAGSQAFIKEAANRALSNSELGYVLVQDRIEGARFSDTVAWEKNFNAGEYQGIKTFNMNPGDEFAVMLIQHTTVKDIANNPSQVGQWGKRAIFSVPEANPGSKSQGQMVDLNNSGAFAMEDLAVDRDQSDRDYNDIVFQIKGANATAASIDRFSNPDRDWRNTDIGKELLEYANRAVFDEGVFQVGESGEVIIDFLYDGGYYQGAEVGIFSLEDMDSYEIGSEAFIKEAVGRAQSNSKQGYVVVQDQQEGARFSASFNWENDYNHKEYQGRQTFLMNPGDTLGLILVPDGTLDKAFSAPDWATKKDPLFSMSAANFDDQIHVADIFTGAEGTIFGFEDVRLDRNSNTDYNDIVIAIEGVKSIGLADIEDVISSNRNWLDTKVGQDIIGYFDDASLI